jgi:DNA-binding MarR family transcriptional regulator
MNHSSYIRFLICINAIKESGNVKKLDYIEEQLLNQITMGYSASREVLTGELLKLSSLASQATLHGRVKSLIKAGYIKQLADPVDGRRKKLIPTKLALKHYEKLSKLLDMAVSA